MDSERPEVSWAEPGRLGDHRQVTVLGVGPTVPAGGGGQIHEENIECGTQFMVANTGSADSKQEAHIGVLFQDAMYSKPRQGNGSFCVPRPQSD